MQNNRSEKVGLSQRSSPEIKLDLFDQNIADLISLKKYTKTENNTLRFQGSVQDKTDIISFSNGLSTTGQFILITAGG